MPPGSPPFSRAAPPRDHSRAPHRGDSRVISTSTRPGSAMRLPGRPRQSLVEENASMRTVSLTALRRIAIDAQGYATRSRAGSDSGGGGGDPPPLVRATRLDLRGRAQPSDRARVARRRVQARHRAAAARARSRVRVLGARGVPASRRGVAAVRRPDARRRAALVRERRRDPSPPRGRDPGRDPSPRPARLAPLRRGAGRRPGCGTGSRRRRCSTGSGITATS